MFGPSYCCASGIEMMIYINFCFIQSIRDKETFLMPLSPVDQRLYSCLDLELPRYGVGGTGIYYYYYYYYYRY